MEFVLYVNGFFMVLVLCGLIEISRRLVTLKGIVYGMDATLEWCAKRIERKL